MIDWHKTLLSPNYRNLNLSITVNKPYMGSSSRYQFRLLSKSNECTSLFSVGNGVVIIEHTFFSNASHSHNSLGVYLFFIYLGLKWNQFSCMKAIYTWKFRIGCFNCSLSSPSFCLPHKLKRVSLHLEFFLCYTCCTSPSVIY